MKCRGCAFLWGQLPFSPLTSSRQECDSIVARLPIFHKKPKSQTVVRSLNSSVLAANSLPLLSSLALRALQLTGLGPAPRPQAHTPWASGYSLGSAFMT